MGFRRGEKIMFKSTNKEEVLDYLRKNGGRLEVIERRHVPGPSLEHGSTLWYYAVG